jgi:virulence factor Mce-like protein
MKSGIARPIAGLATVVVIAAIIALAVGLFQDSFTKTVPVTVISQRAGLVMYPDAKVKLNGAQVGKVASIELLPDGTAALHLAINPARVNDIPANVSADITSSTVFGSKFVELNPPTEPAAKSIQAGQVIDGQHVTVEINTVFQQLVSVLSQIEPAKLNQTLGAIAKSVDGRGDKFGQTLVDLDTALAKINPSLDTLNH